MNLLTTFKDRWYYGSFVLVVLNLKGKRGWVAFYVLSLFFCIYCICLYIFLTLFLSVYLFPPSLSVSLSSFNCLLISVFPSSFLFLSLFRVCLYAFLSSLFSFTLYLSVLVLVQAYTRTTAQPALPSSFFIEPAFSGGIYPHSVARTC